MTKELCKKHCWEGENPHRCFLCCYCKASFLPQDPAPEECCEKCAPENYGCVGRPEDCLCHKLAPKEQCPKRAKGYSHFLAAGHCYYCNKKLNDPTPPPPDIEAYIKDFREKFIHDSCDLKDEETCDCGIDDFLRHALTEYGDARMKEVWSVGYAAGKFHGTNSVYFEARNAALDDAIRMVEGEKWAIFAKHEKNELARLLTSNHNQSIRDIIKLLIAMKTPPRPNYEKSL